MKKFSDINLAHFFRNLAYIAGIIAFFVSLFVGAHKIWAEEYDDSEEIEYCEDDDEYAFAWGGPWVPDWLPHPIPPWEDPRDKEDDGTIHDCEVR